MPLYVFRAMTAAGRARSGQLSAASEGEVKALLRERELYPVEIRPARSWRISPRQLLRLGRGPRLSVPQLAVLTRQLATLLQATIPYDAALGLMAQEAGDVHLQSVLGEVRSRVLEGAYLADALAAYPRHFPPMLINMVRSGETSGALVMVLQRLADYYENSGKLRTKIASALVYPAFMTLFGAGVVSFMVAFIIPRISRLFDSFGATLPLPTRILIGLSNAVTGYWWLVLPLLALAGYGLRRLAISPEGKLWRDRMEVSLPGLRDFRRKVILQRFTQTLATMLKSGVELKVALEAAAQVMENRVYLAAMEHVIFDVQNRGMSLSAALRRAGRFPEDLCQMVAIGEETATLAGMLDTVANRLSQEVAAMLDSATALFEPVLILAMGLVVGFIVISMLLPMLQLNTLVH
ncbi:MAG TPA: type II secretion system F family protein [bacterium]|nr:type II secretion system F family protein [bacterium]